MKLVALAVRNLFRNTRRTVITTLAIGFGLTMMLWMVAIQEGTYEEMISKGISQLAGHVVVQAEGYQEEEESEIVVTGASGIAATLKETFPDAVIAPRIRLGGLLVSPNSSVGAALMGMDPAAEALIQDIDDKIVEGEWLPQDDLRGIVIGRAMADRLGVELGDKIVYMGQHGDEDVVSRLFRVRGIFRTGAAEMDGFLALGHLGAAQEILGQQDVANQVTVHLADPETSEEATATARSLVRSEGVEVLHWREALPQIYAVIQVDRSSGVIMMGIVGLIVAMGVLNTVLMSALERTREFGVMLGLGMKPRQVGGVILLEGTVLGMFGAAAGLVLGSLMTWYAVEHGIDYSAMLGGETYEQDGIALSTHMRGAWDAGRIALYTTMAVLFTILAAVYPAIHVARLRPVEAIHHV